MKKSISIILVFAVVSGISLISSCKKDEPVPSNNPESSNSKPPFGSLPTKPEALAKYDSSNFGLYKGVIAGKISNENIKNLNNPSYQSLFANKTEASGSLRIDFFNSDPKKVFCVLFVNGFYDTLVPPNSNGQFLDSYGESINNTDLIFCRMESQKKIGGENSTLEFYKSNNEYYVNSLRIPGIQLEAEIIKESSFSQTLIFNGNYKGSCNPSSTGSPSGTFNMIINLYPYKIDNTKIYSGDFGKVQYFGSNAINGTTTIDLKIEYQFDLTSKELNFIGQVQDKFTSFKITNGDPVNVTTKGDPNIAGFFYDRNVISIEGNWSVVQPSLSGNGFSCSGSWTGTRQN